jgi:hypothetical protein
VVFSIPSSMVAGSKIGKSFLMGREAKASEEQVCFLLVTQPTWRGPWGRATFGVLVADFTFMEAVKIAAGVSGMPLVWQLCCLAAGTALSCLIGAVTLAPDFLSDRSAQLKKNSRMSQV